MRTTFLLVLALVLLSIGLFVNSEWLDKTAQDTFHTICEWSIFWPYPVLALILFCSFHFKIPTILKRTIQFAVILATGVSLYGDIHLAYDVKTLKFREKSASGCDYLVQYRPGYKQVDSYSSWLNFSVRTCERPNEVAGLRRPKAIGIPSYGTRPLLIYLHGAGEVGKDINSIEHRNPFHYATGCIRTRNFPFVVVSPISPEHGWKTERILTLIDELLADKSFPFCLDPDRVYLTGSSMGGFGTFKVASEAPDHFAAIVPLEGGASPSLAKLLQNTPIWVFHGDTDTVVPISQSVQIVRAMEAHNHPNLHFTVLHGRGHGIPKTVYCRHDLYHWLLQHRSTVRQ